MNIFFTNRDPKQCAREHSRVHVRKMIIETAQLLSAAHRVLDGNRWADLHGFYKVRNHDHPCMRWVRENSANYFWTVDLFDGLCDSYHLETGGLHKVQLFRTHLRAAPKSIPYSGMIGTPPRVVPKVFHRETVAASYQAYLNVKFQRWQARKPPIEVSFFFGAPEWLAPEIKPQRIIRP